VPRLDERQLSHGVDEVVAPDLGPRWNVCPTNQLYVVATVGGVPTGPPVATRRMGTMVWGLVPSWAADPGSGPRPINVRVEGLLDRPHVAGALAGRRCLVPVDGFYEWGAGTGTPPGGPRGARQPFFLAPVDGPVLAIAAVWDRWVPTAGDADALVSCALITTAANDDVSPLHDRMPVALDAQDWDDWLDPANHDEHALLDLLRAPPPGRLRVRAVSPLVNSTANDGPELLADPGPGTPLRGPLGHGTTAPTLFDVPEGSGAFPPEGEAQARQA